MKLVTFFLSLKNRQFKKIQYELTGFNLQAHFFLLFFTNYKFSLYFRPTACFLNQMWKISHKDNDNYKESFFSKVTFD